MRFRDLSLLSVLIVALLAPTSTATAQETGYDGAVWRFGLFGGLNFNILGLGAQTIEGIGTQFTQPNAVSGRLTGENDVVDGTGLGFYFGAMTEYQPGGLLGGQLRVGVDDRRGKMNDYDIANSTEQIRFSARMTYLSVEPLLRINIGDAGFHAVAGPLLSFKIASKFDYDSTRDETDPSIVDQEIQGAKGFTFGVSGGFGYDILMNSKSTSNTRWYLTPFVEASYMLDQMETDFAGQNRNDAWVTTSLRGGFQLKFGSGPAVAPPPVITDNLPTVDLSLRAPSNITDERKMIEMFPLRNYIFFADGQTAVPTKYVKLGATEASNFDEKSLLSPPGTGGSSTPMTRSQRQMGVYYNALNVYGDRLRDNPTAKITLVGSAPTAADGKQMAEDVKSYLVSSFGIDGSRITTQGAVRPPHASGTRATPQEDLDLVREENRRVEVLSDDNNIMKPVMIESTQSEPIDNDLVIGVRTSSPIDSWSMTVTGEGTNQTFGPYRSNSQRIDAKPILAGRSSGNYTATVTARTASGQTITKTQDFSLVHRELPPVTGQRFSILFEFDESRTVQTYEQFLRAEVAPRIPDRATVVVHGHTDKVGLDDYNIELSNRRSQETQRVLQDELKKMGRTATFDAYGFGETEMRAPFGNENPEGRYYNRTVMIEVIPGS